MAKIVVATGAGRWPRSAPDGGAIGGERRVEDVRVTTRPVNGEFGLEKINQLVPVFLGFIGDEIVGDINGAEADADVIHHVCVDFEGDNFFDVAPIETPEGFAVGEVDQFEAGGKEVDPLRGAGATVG